AHTALPDRGRGLSALGRLSTASSETLETEGLPAGSSGLVLDGIPFVPARHPALAGTATAADGSAFPLGAFARAELVSGAADVEWSGFGAGFLSGFARRGSSTPALRGFADWSGKALASSRFFGAGPVASSWMRGGLLLSGP